MEEPAERPEAVLHHHHDHIGVLDQIAPVVLFCGTKIVRAAVDPYIDGKLLVLIVGAVGSIYVDDQAVFTADHVRGPLPLAGRFSLHAFGMPLGGVTHAGPILDGLRCAPAQVAYGRLGVGQAVPDQHVILDYTLHGAVGQADLTGRSDIAAGAAITAKAAGQRKRSDNSEGEGG